jgi:sugar phosphate isomerase/epimerase
MFSPDDFRLSFSTWSAPEQSVPQLVETAQSCGYTGVELRMPGGDIDHAHGVSIDTPPANLAEITSAFAGTGIEVSCIATPLDFGAPEAQDEAGLEQAVDDLKRYVTLAEALGSKCVRVFGGSLLNRDGELAGLVDSVSDALSEAVSFAEQTSVSVLIETYGDFANTKFVREVAKQVYSEHFGVLWDVAHPFRALETPEESYDNISGQVKHVHIHDHRYVDGRLKLEPAMLGEGRVPFGQAIRFLAHDGFEGFLSVETRDGPPEDVLPQHAKVLHDLVTEAFEPDEEEETEAEPEAEAEE